MAEEATAAGVDFTQAQAARRHLRRRAVVRGHAQARSRQKLNLAAIDIYGLSEIMGPGVAIECIEAKQRPAHLGGPFPPRDHRPGDRRRFWPEGETGELVITTLTKQGIPLIRYRTRDITSLTYEPCVCGRTHARMARMSGRTDDMLIIRGVNVFPSQIESILMRHRGGRAALPADRRPRRTTSTRSRSRSRSTSGSSPTRSRCCRRWPSASRRRSRTCSASPASVKLVEPKTIERSEGQGQAGHRQRASTVEHGEGAMKVEQISIFIENKSGRLAEVTRILGEPGINIRALSLADTSDFGILRLIVNRPDTGQGRAEGEGLHRQQDRGGGGRGARSARRSVQHSAGARAMPGSTSSTCTPSSSAAAAMR